MPNARAPPLLSDDVGALVIINPRCGASPGQPGLAPSRKSGLNANTVPPYSTNRRGCARAGWLLALLAVHTDAP